MSHAYLPPSSAEQWVNCTGWPVMTACYPDETESESSREGTAVHELGAGLLFSNGEHRKSVGDVAENGVVFTQDMLDAAKLYADAVLVVQHHTGAMLRVEQTVTNSAINALNFGTPDAYLHDESSNTLYIWDLKYGHGFVDAYKNWQLLNYSALIVKHLNLIDDVTRKPLKLVLTIIQPRNFHRDGFVRSWSVKASDVRGYFNQLINSAADALSPKAVAKSGSHCEYCSARHACASAINAGVALYEVVSQPIPLILSTDAMGAEYALILRAEEQIKFLKTGMEAQITSTIKSGTMVKGWKLEEGSGNLAWTQPIDDIIALGDSLNIDLRKEVSLITPTQAKARGLASEIISAYSGRPKTGLKLVPRNTEKLLTLG